MQNKKKHKINIYERNQKNHERKTQHVKRTLKAHGFPMFPVNFALEFGKFPGEFQLGRHRACLRGSCEILAQSHALSAGSARDMGKGHM
jgi:hypothetical protein